MILDEILKQILIFLYDLIGNYGFSIIALSLVVFLIMLPLFWFAEKLQKKERARKAVMQDLLDEIDGVQNKQEKYFYTKEIYKKYDYKAYYSLISLIGLLIQIPFFLAAYWMLRDFEPLAGQAFGPIEDLSKPDNLLSIGVIKVNILPFLMTIVNFIAIYFVRSSLDKKEIKQLIGTALVFLVALYSFSSALILYWTANNFFSIFKTKIIGVNAKPSTSNFTKDDSASISPIKKYLHQYKQEIFNLLSLLIGYFLFVHFLSNTIDSHSSTSMVFLSLSMLVILAAYLHGSLFKKNLGTSISLMNYTIIVLTSLYFILKTEFELDTLPDISIKEFLRLMHIIVVIGCLFLISKFRTKRIVEDEGIAFLMPKANYLLFIALTIPLTIYIQSNPEYFSLLSGFFYYVLMIGLPLIVCQIVWLLFQRDISLDIYVPSFVAAVLTFYLVPIITDFTQLNSSNNYSPHLILLFILISLFVVLHKLDKKILPFLVISILAIIVVQNVYEKEEIEINEEKTNAVEQFFNSKTIKHKPDIYLLIYDAYVEEDQMKTLYKIDNSKQMGYLKSQNFKIYDNVYSTGRNSLESMSNIVDISNKFDGDENYRSRVNGESVINRILQNNGYLTNNILNPYMIRGSKQKVDYCYPSSGIGMFTIIKAILIGEFKFDIEFSGGYNGWIEKKMEFLKKDHKKPIFLYAHSRYPGHSQNSGTLLPNETELFEKRLKKANKEMKNDLSQILENDKESIIIIAGDHGPYLTGDGSVMSKYKEADITSDHILDRYGVFLAIRYPDSWKKSYGNEIKVVQEVFVNVLANMFETKVPDDLVGNKSSKLGKIKKPVLIDGVIQIGKAKGEPLYK